MNEKRGEVIPFGKYKGQELDQLLGDDEYIKWLLAQSWFKQRYGNIYTVVINHYGQEAVETPAHNAMQVKFLKEEWRLRFFAAASPKYAIAWIDKATIGAAIKNFMISARNAWATHNAHNRPSFGPLDDLLAHVPDWMIDVHTPNFEDQGADVAFGLESTFSIFALKAESWVAYGIAPAVFYRIELKPTVGDDFPEILRQMKRNDCDTLLVQQYVGEGATEEEVVAFFKHAHKRMLFERDLHAAALPDIDAAQMAEVIEEARGFVNLQLKQWQQWKEREQEKLKRGQEEWEKKQREKLEQNPTVIGTRYSKLL